MMEIVEMRQEYRILEKLNNPLSRATVSWLGKIDDGTLKYNQFKISWQNIMQYDCRVITEQLKNVIRCRF